MPLGLVTRVRTQGQGWSIQEVHHCVTHVMVAHREKMSVYTYTDLTPKLLICFILFYCNIFYLFYISYFILSHPILSYSISSRPIYLLLFILLIESVTNKSFEGVMLETLIVQIVDATLAVHKG